MDIGEIIRLTLSKNAFWAISYMFVTTLTIVIMIIVSVQKKNKYMRLKKQTLNFLNIHKKEWEYLEDDFTKQLWDDNERLENEVKVLKKEVSKLSLFGIIVVLIYYIEQKFKKKWN